MIYEMTSDGECEIAIYDTIEMGIGIGICDTIKRLRFRLRLRFTIGRRLRFAIRLGLVSQFNSMYWTFSENLSAIRSVN